MPHCLHIHQGPGWFDVNVSHFFDYLDQHGEELIVRTEDFSSEDVEAHTHYLEELIEGAVNDYIYFVVFGQETKKYQRGHAGMGLILPDPSTPLWQYVYQELKAQVGGCGGRRKPWYEFRKIQ